MNNEEKILAMLEKLNSTVEKHNEVLTQMQAAQAQMQDDISQMQGDISGIKFRLDYDVNKRFDAVNEGIDAIMEKLTPKSRVDELEADVVVLKAAVKALSTEVDELKKAQ